MAGKDNVQDIHKPGTVAAISCGGSQLVICTGKEISSTTQPIIAGLNGLWLSPPVQLVWQ